MSVVLVELDVDETKLPSETESLCVDVNVTDVFEDAGNMAEVVVLVLSVLVVVVLSTTVVVGIGPVDEVRINVDVLELLELIMLPLLYDKLVLRAVLERDVSEDVVDSELLDVVLVLETIACDDVVVEHPVYTVDEAPSNSSVGVVVSIVIANEVVEDDGSVKVDVVTCSMVVIPCVRPITNAKLVVKVTECLNLIVAVLSIKDVLGTSHNTLVVRSLTAGSDAHWIVVGPAYAG